MFLDPHADEKLGIYFEHLLASFNLLFLKSNLSEKSPKPKENLISSLETPDFHPLKTNSIPERSLAPFVLTQNHFLFLGLRPHSIGMSAGIRHIPDATFLGKLAASLNFSILRITAFVSPFSVGPKKTENTTTTS